MNPILKKAVDALIDKVEALNETPAGTYIRETIEGNLINVCLNQMANAPHAAIPMIISNLQAYLARFEAEGFHDLPEMEIAEHTLYELRAAHRALTSENIEG
jgi:hypothetical protein